MFEQYKHLLPDNFRKRAEHYFSEYHRAEEGAEAWRKGDLETYGKLIFESGRSSIENYECGCPELITLYNIMTETDGIYGGRFSGAGFKGCCMALVDPEKADRIMATVEEKYLKNDPGKQAETDDAIVKLDEQYYRTVLRYILQNPMKAGLEKRPGRYRWRSYLAYEKGRSLLTDTQYSLEICGSREKLLEYLTESNDDSVMDEAEHDWRLRDDSAKEIIRRITGCLTITDFQGFDLAEQKEFARKLYMEGLSIRQIARMTGMSKATVARVVKTEENELPETEGLYLRESEESAYCMSGDTIWYG